jgi:hypothetical protein
VTPGTKLEPYEIVSLTLGTPELYLNDPDSITLQIQDMK